MENVVEKKEQVFVFVYKKGENILVLSANDSVKNETMLLWQGYKHIHTLDACTHIQFVMNKKLFDENGELFTI